MAAPSSEADGALSSQRPWTSGLESAGNSEVVHRAVQRVLAKMADSGDSEATEKPSLASCDPPQCDGKSGHCKCKHKACNESFEYQVVKSKAEDCGIADAAASDGTQKSEADRFSRQAWEQSLSHVSVCNDHHGWILVAGQLLPGPVDRQTSQALPWPWHTCVHYSARGTRPRPHSCKTRMRAHVYVCSCWHILATRGR